MRVSLARINGKPSISFRVFKAQDANIVEVGQNLKRAADGVRKQLPQGVELQLLRANSDFVERSADNVKHTIIEGALLTVLIVFLFLGSWRSTIITGLALPISVITTFVALYALNFTLNYMTLMALSLCIGLLIDDAIVVRENIVRHIHLGKNHYAAAREGTEEIGLAVLATTFSIVAVFTPIAFMTGIIGQFFYPFGITVAAAVLVSLFVSFTLDPMLSAIWRDPPEGARGLPVVGGILRRFDTFLEWVHKVYDTLLRAALAHRIVTIVIALASLGVAVPLAKIVGTEMMPQADESFTSLKLTMPVGASLEYADERVQRVEEALRTFKEIEVIDTSIGTEGGKNTGRINLRLVPRADRQLSQKDVERAIRKRLSALPGVQLSVGFQPAIYVALLGNDDVEMQRVIAEFRQKIAAIKGVTDIDVSLKEGTPALSVRLKPELAAEVGLTNAQLGTSLRAFIAGENSGYWR